MEIELISREVIKPSKPTPSYLNTHSLSFIDCVVGRNYVPLVYFYPNKASEYDDNKNQETITKLSTLKKSLSEVLSIYYLFAGTIRDQLSIECNDQGVLLLVTRIKSKVSDILKNPSEALLNPLFPDDLPWKVMGSSESILAIQINCFECGGIAISVCMSHKVGDGSTLFNFVNDWATLARKPDEEGGLPFPPELDAGASVIPQSDLPIFPERSFVKQNTLCRRLVFEGSKIESLKAIVSSYKVENPSRVEIVTALIYKHALSSLKLSNNTPLRVAVNLRKRMVPPLPQKSIGNWVWSFPVPRENEETELHELVTKIREGLHDFCDKNVKHFRNLSFVSEFLKQITSLPTKKEVTYVKPITLFFFASWCNLPTYEVDFGWGKPIWVTSIGSPVKNSVVLMDAKDGNGIEALVNMQEHDLAKFESGMEILQYASVNPIMV
ncbi:hypothetical protein TanjilG_09101 [Lupinus angustifolius]|uniref:Uncharacterized protein n=1 Tax=Lupinus angustifolius TaxID=3871 RepID=A0A4P1R3G8_LUPAN|nr:PREDICTED: acylsugar acyltransferase 3-like [Lupinus angustifolius]OIW00620.1 hypothetical protein TanjilG_09101 [Lupinus angustifolius]